MKPHKFNEQFSTIYQQAVRMLKALEADALLVMLDGPTDWGKLLADAGSCHVLVQCAGIVGQVCICGNLLDVFGC